MLSAFFVHRYRSTIFLILAAMMSSVSVSHAVVYKWSSNGHGYEAVLAIRTWDQAQSECAARGGYLSTIRSDAENCLVHGLFELDPSFWFVDTFGNGLGPWFGGFQVPGSGEPVGEWQWITGEPWDYTNWSPGQPDNCCGLNQNKTHFFRPGDTGFGCVWDDAENAPPAGYIRGYIFETDDPPSDAPVLDTPAGCCGVVPTLRSTWGQLKAIYR